ncbi:hypothetical protein HNY73_007623 [Argiope bruennichi]|uniref:Uncharacterized protein n=1 Tax=Argiope bruennichi TaxID=94029 RepID=A0A8T0FEI2_ARGBR|nr:hypothetical protein HNY73_007623 [Argiope bruennichi]
MTSAKDDYNPFEDPSIKVLTNQSTSNQVTVGSYNPFDKSISNKQTGQLGGVTVDILHLSQHSHLNLPPPPFKSHNLQNRLLHIKSPLEPTNFP